MEQNEIDKRYLVFAYDMYYPNGGLDDLKGSFDLVQDAQDFADLCDSDYFEVYDRIEGVVIYTGVRLPNEA